MEAYFTKIDDLYIASSKLDHTFLINYYNVKELFLQPTLR